MAIKKKILFDIYLWILGVAYGDIIFGVLCIVGDFGSGTVLYVGGRV